jgi:hypothetical protein
MDDEPKIHGKLLILSHLVLQRNGHGLNMAVANTFFTVVNVIIWVLCILLGMTTGSFLGKYIGTLLGWMIANSLDEHIIQGGIFGERFGKFAGVACGVGLGAYGALQVTAFVAHTITHVAH